MKKSTSDIIFTVLKIIIFLAVTAYLAYSVILMVTTEQETGWEALGFVILLAFGVYVNGAALFASAVLLLLSFIFKRSFVKKNEAEAQNYDKKLKIKKRNMLHFGFLAAYSVICEALIFVVGSVIF